MTPEQYADKGMCAIHKALADGADAGTMNLVVHDVIASAARCALAEALARQQTTHEQQRRDALRRVAGLISDCLRARGLGEDAVETERRLREMLGLCRLALEGER